MDGWTDGWTDVELVKNLLLGCDDVLRAPFGYAGSVWWGAGGGNGRLGMVLRK